MSQSAIRSWLVFGGCVCCNAIVLAVVLEHIDDLRLDVQRNTARLETTAAMCGRLERLRDAVAELRGEGAQP